MKEYQAYLFDADGTVMDTRELIMRSYLYTGERLGIDISRDLIAATTGLPVERQVVILLGEGRDEALYAKARELYRERIFSTYPDYLKLFPGTAEVLADLSSRGKKLAVVTSRRRHGLELFFETLGILRYFSVTVTPEDTERHKPDPEPALLAADRLGVRPGEAVFIGDAEFDIASGKAAGMDTAFVEWGGMDYTRWPVQPDFVAGTFYDLLPV